MIETTLDLEYLAPWLTRRVRKVRRVRRVPGTVVDLRCRASSQGDLFFT